MSRGRRSRGRRDVGSAEDVVGDATSAAGVVDVGV